VITVFLPSLSFANDTIAGQICNAYKDEDDRIKCFDELTEVPRYISFKFGVSACPKVKYWEEFIDEYLASINLAGSASIILAG
jgi:hypothetical protein